MVSAKGNSNNFILLSEKTMNTIQNQPFTPQIQQKAEYSNNVDLIKDIFAYGVLLFR